MLEHRHGWMLGTYSHGRELRLFLLLSESEVIWRKQMEKAWRRQTFVNLVTTLGSLYRVHTDEIALKCYFVDSSTYLRLAHCLGNRKYLALAAQKTSERLLQVLQDSEPLMKDLDNLLKNSFARRVICKKILKLRGFIGRGLGKTWDQTWKLNARTGDQSSWNQEVPLMAWRTSMKAGDLLSPKHLKDLHPSHYVVFLYIYPDAILCFWRKNLVVFAYNIFVHRP